MSKLRRTKLTNALRDKVVHLETAKNLCASPRQEDNFLVVMVAKRLQTRTEEEIQQPLRDKNSKSTDKATHNAVKTLRDFCKEQNLDKSFQDFAIKS